MLRREAGDIGRNCDHFGLGHSGRARLHRAGHLSVSDMRLELVELPEDHCWRAPGQWRNRPKPMKPFAMTRRTCRDPLTRRTGDQRRTPGKTAGRHIGGEGHSGVAVDESLLVIRHLDDALAVARL